MCSKLCSKAVCILFLGFSTFILQLLSYPDYDVLYRYLLVLDLDMKTLPSEMGNHIWALSISFIIILLTFSILFRASYGVLRRVMCSGNVFVYMVPFCILGLYLCIFIRTLLTIFPDYNVPLTDYWSLPLPDLDMKILPSIILTLVIWVLLSFVSLVLTFTMPWRVSYRVFRRQNTFNKLTILIDAIIALVLESLVFLFVYNVYAVELVSFLQLILLFPLLSFVVYSFFQGYILSLDLYGAFTQFHIALRILFNGVTILHGLCIIVIGIYKPNRFNTALAIIGLMYRLWVAAKYTNLLRRSRAKRERAGPQHPRQDDDDDGDLVLSRNNPGDHFYHDKDVGSGETYRPGKSEEDKSYDKSKSFLVVNYCLFHTLWIKRTHEQIIKLSIGFFMTVFYLLLCYMLVLLFSTYENISLHFISIVNDTMVTST